MKRKISTWVKRYGPAEIVAVFTTLVGGIVINILFHNAILTALGGTWGDNMGYYGSIIIRDIIKLKKKHRTWSMIIFAKLTRNLFLEFGPSEYLDAFIARPFFMYIFPKLLHNIPLGLIAGKFTADITFYIPTIISFELKNKFLKD